MNWFKKKTDEELLQEAEQRREESRRILEALKERWEIEQDIARDRIESEYIRNKLKNPMQIQRAIQEEKRKIQNKDASPKEKKKSLIKGTLEL